MPTRRRRLTRKGVDHPLPTGVRAIDAALTVGDGQRVGIFAMAGGGKSTLLGMLARRAQADVNVIALVGERGREVREFLDESLGEEGLARSVIGGLHLRPPGARAGARGLCGDRDRRGLSRARASACCCWSIR